MPKINGFEMLELLDARGAEYPAEHNVGHLYEAKPELAAFYQKLDPCNCFNPGIGKTSKFAAYREPEGGSGGGSRGELHGNSQGNSQAVREPVA